MDVSTRTTHEDRREQLHNARLLLSHRPREAWMIASALLEDGDTREVAQVRALIAQSLSAQGRLHEARPAFEAAEAAFLALGDTLQAACCRRDWAVVVYYQGNYPVAARAFEEALGIIEAHNAPADACQCLCWMALMAGFRQLVDDAKRYVAQARGLIDPAKQPFEAAFCLIADGANAQRVNEWEESERALTAAADALAAIGEPIWQGIALGRLGFTLRFSQQWERAARVTDQACSILEESGSAHQLAIMLELKGILALETGMWDRAYQFIALARAFYVEQGMEVLTAQADLHRANVDYWLDDWNAAEQGYTAMSEVARRFGSYHHLLLAESNLGLLAYNRERFDQALLHTSAALEQAVAIRRPNDAARCHRQLSHVYSALQRWDQAKAHYEAAVRMMEDYELLVMLGETQAEYAEFLRKKGALTEAHDLIERARTLVERVGTPLALALCEYRAARIMLACGDLERADFYARRSYAEQRRLEATGEMALIDVVFGGIARARGDLASARPYFERAFAILARPFPGEAMEAATALAEIADDAATALAWYRRAVDVARQARNLVPSEHVAANLARQAAPALRAALALAHELGADQTALQLVEDARAQVALAWLEGQRMIHADDTDRDLALRCAFLRDEIEALEQQPEHDAARLEALHAAYDDALALRRRFGSDVLPGTTQPFDWEHCRDQLDRLHVRWQALVYWLDDTVLWTFSCDRDTITTTRRQLTPEQQHSLALCCDTTARRRTFLFDRDPATCWTTDGGAVHLRRVADLLIPPACAASLAPDTLLAIVPAGILHALPFAALPIDGAPLIAHATICLAPSLHILGRLVERGTSTATAALAIGVTHHHERDELPRACDEATMVAARRDGSSWCDAAATTTRLRESSDSGELARFRTIHLATHAWMVATRGEQAGIAFADDDMLVADLAHLRLDADTVVLSACESGIAAHHEGEEMVGLTYALLQAGSRALVASLWKIDDSIAFGVMRMFYDAMDVGATGPWALAHMQRAALAAGYPPFDWAGYQWIGRPT